MSSTQDVPPDDEASWRDFLTRGDSREHKVRGFFKRIPHGPRCKLCAAPFAGVGAPLMRMIGKRPSNQNPTMCTACFAFLAEHHGGAEIECSFLFADVRGSTTIAEGMSATSFRALLDRFYATATTPAAAAAGLHSTLERRSLDLKGKELRTDVVVLRV